MGDRPERPARQETEMLESIFRKRKRNGKPAAGREKKGARKAPDDKTGPNTEKKAGRS